MVGVFETVLMSMVGVYGKVGLFFVMIVQTIIAPIPSEALLVFAGAFMDIRDVVVFGGLGLVFGSAIAFVLARKGGRPLVAKLIGDKWTRIMDDWVSRNGAKSILLTRLVPFIPFDLISYVSGITKVSFTSYMLATVLGAFPRTLMLAYAGGLFSSMFVSLGGALDVLFIIGIGGFLVLAYMERKGYFVGLENTILGRLVKRIWRS